MTHEKSFQERQLKCKYLGLSAYEVVWENMEVFTNERSAETSDEIWLVEHPSVFTLGQAGKEEHILDAGNIPVIKTDRGGQVTYHGPGQLVAYVLFDLRRLGVNVRQLVSGIEASIINLLSEYDISAHAKKEAPGVYVGEKKIAALGLRIRRGCSFHGLSLNVDMDVAPYKRINPCGYADMEMVQLRDFNVLKSMDEVSEDLLAHMQRQFGYTSLIHLAH
ncbi:MAG: lipoyl(octanoyl) transferase [Candidatus Azotimanducaceae bacterium]|jgi:lipoyl(octanoyl) transferase